MLCGDHGGVTQRGRPCRRTAYRGGQCAQHQGAHPGGAPRYDFTDEQVEQIEKLAAMLNQEQMADFLGITDRTIRRRMVDDARVQSAYKRGRAKVIGSVSHSLIQQARDGNTVAMIFFLKTQAGWREKQEIALTDPSGGPLEVVVTRRIVRAASGDD